MKTSSWLVAALLTVTAHGESRTSARYALNAESLGAGAGTVASTRLSSTSHVGSIGALRQGAALAVRAGFAGTIANPTALTLRADPSMLEENSALALGAELLLDDATTLAVPPGEVAWSVLDGPVQVSPLGVVSAALLYSDQNATLGALHAGFSTQRQISILNLNTDDFGSYAADGIDDAWQVLHFGEENPLAQPTLDPDGDLQTNRFEYQAGTLPRLATSAFRVRIEGVPAAPAARRILFSPRLEGRTYTLERSTTLGPSQNWQPVIGALVDDVAEERSLTDPNAPIPTAFYRIVIEGP